VDGFRSKDPNLLDDGIGDTKVSVGATIAPLQILARQIDRPIPMPSDLVVKSCGSIVTVSFQVPHFTRRPGTGNRVTNGLGAASPVPPRASRTALSNLQTAGVEGKPTLKRG